MGDAPSPLQFVRAMMPRKHILRKCTSGYKLSKSQEKINHLMYMDNIKLFRKNEKELETLRIYSQDNGIRHRKMRHANNEKQETTHDGRMELPNQEKSERSEKKKPSNTWEYWKLTPSNN